MSVEPVTSSNQSDENPSDPSETALITSSPPLFKLDPDCFEELFEFLRITDQQSLGKTCTRMKKLVNYTTATNYPGIPQPRVILDDDEELPSHINSDAKEIELNGFRINKNTIKCTRKIWHQIETIRVIDTEVKSNLYESLLQNCENLKYLSISSHWFAEFNTIWMRQKYPKLNHIEFDLSLDAIDPHQDHYTCIPDLKTFFTLNSNIHQISASFFFLMANAEFFKTSQLKFDQVNICPSILPTDWSAERDLLQELYEKGFYQRLHWYGRFSEKEHSLDITSFPGLENLFIDFEEDINTNVPVMPNVKQLTIKPVEGTWNQTKWEQLANNLKNVERIHFTHNFYDSFAPVIRYFANVRHIVLKLFLNTGNEDSRFFDGNVIDLVALNEERAQLPNARKVTLYALEQIYLNTKWITKSTNLDFIELKRIEAYECKIDIDRNYDFWF